MKKSAMVTLGALAVAASMTGCHDDATKDVRTCVDRSGNVVDERYCAAQSQTANGQNPDDHFVRDMLLYHWIFGGSYQNNRYVSGGGFYPAPRVVYVPSYSSEGVAIRSSGSAAAYGAKVGGGYGGVSRGGFGSSFSSGAHASGGGE